MRKYAYIIVLALIAGTVIFTSCRRMEQMMDPMMPDAEMIETPTEMVETPVDLVDVLIYTNRSFWITLEDAVMAAETTKRLLDAAGVQAEITKNDAYVREWMLHTTGDDNMNIIVLYGVLPASVYGTGNSEPDGSIAENWIETTDGDTILNHADYIAYNTDFDVDKVTEWTPDDALTAVGSNQEGGLQNLMDNPTISLFTAGLSSMMVTSDGAALTPSLANFDSERPIPLNQLQGEWFAEKVFASDTGNAEATYADPVILRDGDLGRLAIVHATTKYEGLLNGEVATEMIVNYLLAAPTMMETVETPPEPTPPEVVNIDLTDPNALPNRLTIEGGTLVSASLPETSTAATAPRLQADITEVNASPGGTIFLPFEYSGANALAGCIVCIEGVPGYYDLPYTGAADALPTAIPVGLSINLELGTFEVCYSVYDDQGQYGNFLTAVINVEAITDDLIPDANLAAAVRETLGLPADALLTAEVLATLEALEAPGREIVDLTGLEHAMNLRSLNLGWDGDNNQISDVSPLANLTNLTYLNLTSNQVSDISGLANLTQLTILYLWNTQVSDISVLANLTQLTNLYLGGNQLSDISVLANLTQLTILWLQNTQVSDISPLANLTKLTTLWLQNNQVSDISVLANLTQLTNLYLGGNQVSDISVLANLTKLTNLGLDYNQVSDISVLANLTQLTNLYLNSNQVSDISVLANLTQLTRLYLHNNQVSDISPLVANTGLDSGDTVRLQNNPLNAAAINTHIPALQARGVRVEQ